MDFKAPIPIHIQNKIMKTRHGTDTQFVFEEEFALDWCMLNEALRRFVFVCEWEDFGKSPVPSPLPLCPSASPPRPPPSLLPSLPQTATP